MVALIVTEAGRPTRTLSMEAGKVKGFIAACQARGMHVLIAGVDAE